MKKSIPDRILAELERLNEINPMVLDWWTEYLFFDDGTRIENRWDQQSLDRLLTEHEVYLETQEMMRPHLETHASIRGGSDGPRKTPSCVQPQ